jgi:hypothetical protein
MPQEGTMQPISNIVDGLTSTSGVGEFDAETARLAGRDDSPIGWLAGEHFVARLRATALAAEDA